MSEKLIIRNFGPIKDVELDLKKFNVIIGENATGKSTIAKVLAVCKYFSYIALDDAFIAGRTKFSSGLERWGLSDAIKNDSYIFYESDHYTLKVEQVVQPIWSEDANEDGTYNNIFTHSFVPDLKAKSREFVQLLAELNKVVIKNRRSGSHPTNKIIPTSFYLNDVANVMDNPFYIPTERGLQSIFSLGQDSIPNLSNSLFNQFAKLDSIARDFKNETIIEPLEIIYKNVEGRGYFKKEGQHDFLSLYNGASGYKSAIPIVLVVKYYNEFKKKKKTFIIEEPELNLFPSAQKELINYLVEYTINKGNNALLTTHSPYTLTSLNNLMYAYEVGKKETEVTSEVIDKKYWLNPEEVSAYRLLADGTCEDIVDKGEDATLIKAEKIDEISGKLNENFDKLISLEILNTSEK